MVPVLKSKLKLGMWLYHSNLCSNGFSCIPTDTFYSIFHICILYYCILCGTVCITINIVYLVYCPCRDKTNSIGQELCTTDNVLCDKQRLCSYAYEALQRGWLLSDRDDSQQWDRQSTVLSYQQNPCCESESKRTTAQWLVKYSQGF